MFFDKNEPLTVAARSSRLSRAQVAEVLQELRTLNSAYASFNFIPCWTETRGDRDLLTPLRHLDKTDFFTDTVDRMVVEGHCRIAIHSAKDLPDVLPKELEIVAITKGVDSSDSLVFPQTLSSQPRVGVSCHRREEAVKKLYPEAQCRDIRGTIDHRLAQLQEGHFDAVVIAEAALIRLELTHLNRMRLDCTTAPLQGQLAIVARAGDRQMQELFGGMDVRTLSGV